MGTERCNFCSITMNTRDLKRCANCKAIHYCVSPSITQLMKPNTRVHISLDIPLEMQSKACQKLHWKLVHKRECAEVKSGRDLMQGLGAIAHTKEKSRWMNAWHLVMVVCVPISLDLANKEWGHHDTHVLAMKVEYTGLNDKDKGGQLFRVTEAKVEPCADVIKTFPVTAEGLTANSPGEWPRVRCVVSSRGKNCPTQRDYVRVYSWYIPYLRELYYNLDKRHSHAAAMLAIPLLLNNVNTLKEPRLAERGFRAMVGDPDTVRALLELAGNVTEESLRQFLEQTFRE